jgi:hypothetical protein
MTWKAPCDESKKAEAIRRIAAGDAKHAVAASLGVNVSTIRRWMRGRPPQTKHKIKAHHSNIVLVIPDMHHPFAHPDALDFLRAVKRRFHPTHFVCLGDEIDAHAFSRYPKDPDGMNAGQEFKAAVLALQPYYIEFPDMLVCESNHTVRPWKKAFEAGLPASFLPTVAKAMNAPDGWVWRKKHELDGVLYVHGDNGRSGQYAAVNYMKQAKQPVVIGHIHAYASVFYEGKHFAMNTGCLINRDTYPFHYASGQLLDVNIGCGIVVDGKEAYFIPMKMDSNDRWIGRL